MAMVNPDRVRADVIEATEFRALSQRYRVMAVPRIVINDKIAFDGALPEPRFLEQVQRALAAPAGPQSTP